MMKRTWSAWFPFVLLSSFFSITFFAGVQQVTRSGANDPQVEMSEDAVSHLANPAASPQSLVDPEINIEKSLAPYLIIFDDKNEAVASGASLDGSTPVPPRGVFEYLRSHPEDRFTWEPKSGVRNAVVMRRVEGPHAGFVLAGRSMRETEARVANLGRLVFAAWIAFLVISFGYSFYITRKH
ncbi:MAG: hypothetical protein JWN89_63 [Parcubacteria group bacterium]|nr:hypothetical protein [Parcubacteria group bacterium]